MLTGMNTNFTPFVFGGPIDVSMACMEFGVGGCGFSGDEEAEDEGEKPITVAGRWNPVGCSSFCVPFNWKFNGSCEFEVGNKLLLCSSVILMVGVIVFVEFKLNCQFFEEPMSLLHRPL